MIKKYIKRVLMSACIFGLSAFAWSCDSDKDGPEMPPQKEKAQTTLLIYAVATNSLSGNLVSDKNEMLAAAESIDLDKNNILLFETRYLTDENGVNTSQVRLLRLSSLEDGFGWKIVKEFENGYPSLEPANISSVVQYVAENYPGDNNGMIFWSHSTASQPFLYSRASQDLPMLYSFGQDQIYKDEEYNQINVDALAAALPDNHFDYVWFDSCYMSNIETIYEFRGKCDTFVGYPTEVLEYGLPYDIVLPHLVGAAPDLKKAASLFFNYYNESSYAALRIATIAVTDMKKINLVADIFESVSQEGLNVSTSSLMKYSRYSTGPFYDLGDYARLLKKEQIKNSSVGDLSDDEIDLLADEFNKEWEDVLEECIIYKAATPYNFSNQLIDQDAYSGISAHVYSFGSQDSASESYYKSLSWYQDTFVK